MTIIQKIIDNRLVRFVGVGGLNTFVTYILYLLLILIVNYQVAYTITYIVGIFLAYWLSLKIVFQTKSTKKKLFLFPFVYLFQYLFGLLIMYVLIEILGLNQFFAPLVVAICSIPITFILSRFILR